MAITKLVTLQFFKVFQLPAFYQQTTGVLFLLYIQQEITSEIDDNDLKKEEKTKKPKKLRETEKHH